MPNQKWISKHKLANRVKEHKQSWKHCTLCEIGTTATNHVLFDGPIPATYLFIGEAPGVTEDLTGTPFIGNSGKVLRSILRELRITDESCIGNIIACLPSAPDKDFRQPHKTEVINCLPRLRELISLVKPKYTILLGNIAKKFFPPDCEHHLELKHPSFILRNGGIGSVEYKRNLLKLKGLIQHGS